MCVWLIGFELFCFVPFVQLAISMATKAASLGRELKSIKSDLCFVQERCAILEEENRRLRDGFAKGIRPEEDDLVSPSLHSYVIKKKIRAVTKCGGDTHYGSHHFVI